MESRRHQQTASSGAISTDALIPHPPSAQTVMTTATVSGSPQQQQQQQQQVPGRKTRRLKERIFLREMERLAEELCQEALQGHPPTQVCTKDIRSHLSFVHQAIDSATGAQLNTGTGSAGSRPVTREEYTTTTTTTTTTTALDPRRLGLMNAESVPVGPSTGTDFPQWQDELHDSAGGQANYALGSRLRGHGASQAKEKAGEYMSYGSTGYEGVGSSQYMGGPPVTGRSLGRLPSPPPIKVKSFGSVIDAPAMRRLDQTMDGNTVCLSSRTPRKRDKVFEALHKGVPLPPVPPPAPTAQTVLAQIATAKSKSARDRQRSKRIGGVGAGWSARDIAARNATLRAMRKVPRYNPYEGYQYDDWSTGEQDP